MTARGSCLCHPGQPRPRARIRPPRASLGMLGWEKDLEMLPEGIHSFKAASCACRETTGIAPALLQEDVQQHMKEINNH